jgi:NAD+ diphosphatase
MVAVIKDDKILLARSNRFATGWYSVIAGFVEPGEALEDCVKRELKEEVGIEVTNIQYFGSQPWPFPDSLMIAFTARWSKGIITIDNEEIIDANWYSANNLPNLPGKVSIARQLIDWFVEHAKF